MSAQVVLHLVSVAPAMFLGIVVLVINKGTQSHKLLGRSWVALMLIASVTSFFIQSDGGFSWIHILSVVSIASITLAIWAIRNGKVRMHRGFMIGAFSGAIVAGIFAAITPGRAVHDFLLGGG